MCSLPATNLRVQCFHKKKSLGYCTIPFSIPWRVSVFLIVELLDCGIVVMDSLERGDGDRFVLESEGGEGRGLFSYFLLEGLIAAVW